MNLFDIPLVTPLKLFRQNEFPTSQNTSTLNVGAFNENFNSTPFDADWLINQLHDWQDKKQYLQPYQKGDFIQLYWTSETEIDATKFVINVLDCKGNISKGGFGANAINPSKTVISGANIYHYKLTLWDLAEGEYFIQVAHNAPDSSYLISEPFSLKEVHKDTVLFEYNNTYNAHSVFFEQTGIKFQIRASGSITEMTPSSKIEVYDDQPLSSILLSSRPFREWSLKIGSGKERISEWFADKIERALSCDNLKIDSDFYTRSEGSKLEPARIKGHPLDAWEISLRDRYNKDSLAVSELGVYNFGALPKTKLFYVNQFVQTFDPNIPIDKQFSGARNFVDYLNNFLSLDGFFSINSKHELVYEFNESESTLKTAWVSNSIALSGVLPYWFAVELESTASSTIDLDVTFAGSGNRFIDYGDGNLQSFGTGNTTHAFGNTGLVEVKIFVDNQTEVRIKTAGDYAIQSLAGEVSPMLETLEIPSEIIKEIKGDLFKFANGAFQSLDLRDNSLSVSQINKIITMLRSAQLQNSLSSPGLADISLQNPLSPPSGGSIRGVLVSLSNSFSIVSD